MIIKRDGMFRMLPSLKRCRLRASPLNHDDDESSLLESKRRKLHGQFPLYLLGEVAAGVITCHSSNPPHQSQSAMRKSSPSSSSRARDFKSRPVEEVSKPPLVRTSRGRVQVLPSKFNDSILDNWKKDTKPELDECALNGDANDSDWGRKELGHKASKLRGSSGNAKRDKCSYTPEYMYSSESPTYDQEEEEDDEEEEEEKEMYRKYTNSVKTARGRLDKKENGLQFEAPGRSHDKRIAKGLMGIDEFGAGDIVWAK